MSRYDPDWLNAQYDNRARVADHGRHLARWPEASALARARSDCRLDLRYGEGPSETRMPSIGQASASSSSHTPSRRNARCEP